VNILGYSSLALFSITTFLIWRYLKDKSRGDNHPSKSLFLGTWLASIITMLIFLYYQLDSTQGIDFNFYNTLLISSGVVCIILYLASIVKHVEFLGLIVLPATIGCLLLNIVLSPATSPISIDPGIQTHIVTSIIAFSVLCLAAVQSILLLIQNRHLKQHTAPGILRALPSLHENEAILFQSIGVGVILLTIALASGFIFLDDIFAQHLVHKTALSILAWIVFVTLLWGRVQFGWRGTTVTSWTLGGFSFLILAYFGSKFVLELVLQRA
jgi:ABC-type uncharacterized transport system permease subunit